MDVLDEGLKAIESQRSRCYRLRQHWLGEAPAAYLSAEARSSLDNRLARLSVNFPRLVVSSHANRLALAGMSYDDQPAPVWAEFRRAGGERLASLIHSDRLLYGAAYLTVWSDGTEPTLTGDTPASMAVGQDPATGAVLYAVRRWSSSTADHAAVFLPDRVELWTANTGAPAASGSAWRKTSTVDNPLDVVPVVPFVRMRSLGDDPTGASILDDITDLTDAIAKLLSDAMVTSEFYARPRRWATGLEIEERPVVDVDGQPKLDADTGEPLYEVVDPFASGRHLQSESPETKFGQLEASRLDGYADLIATLTQQVGSLTGLPPHYLGLHGDQPASSDGVKAAETQLVVAAYEAQRELSEPWRDVAWILSAVSTGTAPDPAHRRDWSVAWQSPEIRTPAQAADAALKHRQVGVPLRYVLRYLLGDTYPPSEVDAIAAAARTDALMGSLNGRVSA
jgi:hypothetical protein